MRRQSHRSVVGSRLSRKPLSPFEPDLQRRRSISRRKETHMCLDPINPSGFDHFAPMAQNSVQSLYQGRTSRTNMFRLRFLEKFGTLERESVLRGCPTPRSKKRTNLVKFCLESGVERTIHHIHILVCQSWPQMYSLSFSLTRTT